MVTEPGADNPIRAARGRMKGDDPARVGATDKRESFMNLHDSRGRRAAENQSVFRSINEHIGELNESWDYLSPLGGSWVCECTQLDCTETVRMTPSEYQDVRADPTHFVVAPADAHVVAEVERVIGRNDRYWIVEKLGAAAERAEELNPR